MLLLIIDFFMSGGPKGAICVFACLSANLALQEFFQAINFHFTRTTKHQPTRNLHSSTQLVAVTSTASHFHTYLSATWDKNTTKIANGRLFLIFDHFHCKFVAFILKFFTFCGFPNNFIDVVSPNSWVESKFLHAQRTPKLCSRLLPTSKA